MYELVIAGEGEAASGAKKRAAEFGLSNRVRFTGYVRGLDKARVLLDACIFVLPTYHQEGLPNSILEAMGAGAVVVTSKAGGIPEIVKSPDNGIILDDINPTSISNALIKILEDKPYISEVSRRNRAIARTHFESHVVTRRIENLYKEIAAE